MLSGRKNIRRQEATERKSEREKVVMIGTTTAATAEEVTAVVNIPEEVHVFDGLMIPMECSLQQVHLWDITSVTVSLIS